MSGQTKIITAVFLGLLLIGKALSAEEQTILAGGSPFRAFAMWREQVAEGEAFGPFVGIKFLPPPVAWTSIDFDDQDWYRSFGPFSGEELHKSCNRSRPCMMLQV